MKLDRRTFIELGVGFSAGAGAGFMLTPVNWKLIDDMSIWSQELWPRYQLGGLEGRLPQRGKVTHADSVCNLCPGGCGITVRKVADRVTKIEGREEYPINNGGICPLGAAGLQFLYGPWRAPSPLKRVGKRGSGHFEQITWDEAINEVVQKLGDLRRKGQSHTVACILGSDRGTVPQLFDRFLKAYGSPNFIRTASAEDTYELTLGLMQGDTASVGYDLERANFILSFGSGLIEGWGSPVRGIKAHSIWRSGDSKERATVVQIEPRLSNTAAKADNWYPINPGTEAALALGLAHVIVKESLYDSNFIRNHTFGFKDWSDASGNKYMGFKRLVLTKYAPGAVSGITGLSATRIVELARAFARAERPLAVWGRGKGTVSGSLYECMAIHALNALAGNINKPGGVSTRPEVATRAWPGVSQDATALKGSGKPRIDGAGTGRYPLTKYLPERWPQVINEEKAGTIQALLVHEADPYYTTLDSATVAKAFDRIPFVVSFSTYMDETAYHADLILPNHHYLERWEDLPTPVGLQKPILGLLKPVVSPQFDTRHAGDVIMTIAKALGRSVGDAFPWKDYETVLKETIGDKWDTLEEAGYIEDADYRPPAWEKAFGTPSGKFEFYITAFDQTGMKISKDLDYLPHYEPVHPEGNADTYPLILIPAELMRLANGAIGNPPFCTKSLEETELKRNDLFVEVNPKTAANYGLSEGHHAMLETPRGKAKVLVHLFEGIMPGLISIPKGLGHAAYDDYLAGKGVSANSLMGVVEDPITGLSATWGIRAKLTRV
ncbi:MAG: molybdopterin-dependent oxidoreductase [Desulfobacterales bacterium]|nr:molybdopterin-dependent oxidoreductase [Desulfobacterales bacterium]